MMIEYDDFPCAFKDNLFGANPNKQFIKRGFIRWTDNPNWWAGAFKIEDESYAYLELVKLHKLRSLSELNENSIDYYNMSWYYFPERARKKSGISDTVEIDGKKYSRSRVSQTQVELLLSIMKNDEIEKRQQEIEECVKHAKLENEHSIPHKEKPYKIYMAGTDDFSYTSVFETEQLALNVIELLEKSPTWNNIFK
jgi:hypothetical protein